MTPAEKLEHLEDMMKDIVTEFGVPELIVEPVFHDGGLAWYAEKIDELRAEVSPALKEYFRAILPDDMKGMEFDVSWDTDEVAKSVSKAIEETR